jgi:predicted dehydrogenase
MKQVLQSYRTGELRVVDVPAPTALPGTVLVRTHASLISAGTERMVIDLAKKSLVGKAQDRPDLVKKVIDKVGKDGVVATARTVLTKLDAPIPLGYSVAGTVLERGAEVSRFKPGDRIACAGAKVANHAEFNVVPVNLCTPIPERVSDEEACFVTVGAIALHGLRCAQPTLGERVAVIGLGLIGQLALQLARAHGCRTIGIDLDPKKVELARACGATAAIQRQDDVAGAIAQLTAGRGVDIVLICAATDSNDPIELAGEICRDRGRVVAVGAVNLDLPRRPFYDKEIQFVVSRAYGPGRYDTTYEERGVDYPFGYVRWTEGRNLEAFLDLCADGALDVRPLITHRFPIAEAEQAYERITTPGSDSLGVVLTYPRDTIPSRTIDLPRTAAQTAGGALDAARSLLSGRPSVEVGVIGAGNFATSVLVPALARARGARLAAVASARGISARHLAERHGFTRASTSGDELLRDPHLDAVVITTRHDRHADEVCAALAAGKHVFVEKPLAIEIESLQRVAAAARACNRVLLVGFNRRFAPLAQQLAEAFADRTGPLVMHYRVNAGPVPADSWIHDPLVGGGRILGEVCHFVDFVSFLCGSHPVRVTADSVSGAVEPTRNDDQVTLTLRMADGSLATITYASGGDPAYPKERIEVMGSGRLGVLNDFRSLEISHGGRRKTTRGLTQDKGHDAEMQAFIEACRGGRAPIPLDSLLATTLATFGALESLRTGRAVPLDLATVSLTLPAEV